MAFKSNALKTSLIPQTEPLPAQEISLEALF